MSSNKVKIIPCSGMGKVFGLLARETALKVANELCPEGAETVCLSYVVTGDEDVKRKVEKQKCITIDGCATMCAAKNASFVGGTVIEEARATDAFKKHRGVYAGTATKLTDAGWQMVDEMAEEIAHKVKSLCEEAE